MTATAPDRALAAIDGWGAANAAAALVGPDGAIAVHGDVDRTVWWASITKLVTGLAVLTAVEDGTLDLDEKAPPPAPPGATIRHLLSHSPGLPFDGEGLQGRPGTRRIYSNTGFDVLGALLGERDGHDFEASLRQRVMGPHPHRGSGQVRHAVSSGPLRGWRRPRGGAAGRSWKRRPPGWRDRHPG